MLHFQVVLDETLVFVRDGEYLLGEKSGSSK